MVNISIPVTNFNIEPFREKFACLTRNRNKGLVTEQEYDQLCDTICNDASQAINEAYEKEEISHDDKWTAIIAVRLLHLHYLLNVCERR